MIGRQHEQDDLGELGWRFYGIQAADGLVGLMIGFVTVGMTEIDGWWLPVAMRCK